jgi:hypothetical protein
LSENIDVVQRGIAAKGLTPFETGGSTPPAENDAPDVVRSRIDRPIDLGNDEANLREATRQRREWEQGLHGDSPPDMGTEEQPTIARQNAGIIERRIQADYKPARTAQTGLKEITEALSNQHWLERPESHLAREIGLTDEQQLAARESEDLRKQVGYTPEEWAHYQRTGEIKAPKPFLANERIGIRQPIEDHERILFDAGPRDVLRNAREAQREMRLGHEVEQVLTRQQIAEAEARVLALQQQAPAAEQPVQSEAAAAPAQAQVEQPQVDPAMQLSQAYSEAVRASDEERLAGSQIHQWNAAFYKAFPEATNQAALAETRQRNPARFAQLQQAAQKTAVSIDGWMKRGAAATEARRSQENQVVQHQQAAVRAAWHQYKEAEDAKLHQFAPELNDAVKASAMRQGVRTMLNEIGFANDELTRAWNGESGFSVRDHRAQRLILDAYRWRQAQTRAKTINANRAVPNVQRPGVARPRGADSEADIGRLQRELAGASGANAIRIARQLTQAKRAAGQL